MHLHSFKAVVLATLLSHVMARPQNQASNPQSTDGMCGNDQKVILDSLGLLVANSMYGAGWMQQGIDKSCTKFGNIGSLDGSPSVVWSSESHIAKVDAT